MDFFVRHSIVERLHWRNQKVKKVKTQLEKMVVKAAYKTAEKNANSVCGFLFYQPKQPDAVKKLRKF